MECECEWDENWDRKYKSINERIVLVNVAQSNVPFQCISDNVVETIYEHIDVDILGQTNKQYTINIMFPNNEVRACCSCPDFVIRKKVCKHIYWIGYKIIGRQPQDWTLDMFQELCEYFKEYSSDKEGRNHDCPICLETIDYTTQQTICCETQCQNSVHRICWLKYYQNTLNTKCVICKTDILNCFY